jgi:hypothetical protein
VFAAPVGLAISEDQLGRAWQDRTSDAIRGGYAFGARIRCELLRALLRARRQAGRIVHWTKSVRCEDPIAFEPTSRSDPPAFEGTMSLSPEF